MKKLMILAMLSIALMSFSQHSVQSARLNDFEWKKCEFEVISNFTEKTIEIKTPDPQFYTFEEIISLPKTIEGYAVDKKGKRVYIVMSFLKDHTFMAIGINEGVVIQYLID